MSNNLKQVELAKQTLQVFERHRENMSEARHVVHYFYGGDSQALADELRKLGYETRPTAARDGVIAERHEAIGERWRTTTLVQLCELADSYRVEYDGWEASMNAPPTTAPSRRSGGWLAKLFGK